MEPKMSDIGKRSGKVVMTWRSNKLFERVWREYLSRSCGCSQYTSDLKNKFCNLLHKMRQVICNFAVSLDGFANVHRPAADVHFKLTRDFAVLNCDVTLKDKM